MSDDPNLTDAEQAMAQSFGMTAEQYAAREIEVVRGAYGG